MASLVTPLTMLRLLSAQRPLMPPAFWQALPLRHRLGAQLVSLGARPLDTKRPGALAARIAALGPSYIKLGQFFATRPDIIGEPLAHELAHLQDRLPPFAQAQAQEIVRAHVPCASELTLGPAMAAASIAQVHKARFRNRDVAVKILRPNILAQLEKELAFFLRLAERLVARSSEAARLRPRAAIRMLQASVRAECDLRLEAAALSEMRDNTKDDDGFILPDIIWEASSEQVLVTEWMEATRIDDIAALKKQKQDMPQLGTRLIHAFLTHALRDGLFHGDMHPGNIFVNKDGALVALDLGIMGRLDAPTRYHLAQILQGFIARDYTKAARAHFRAGYVPPAQDVTRFAQALRAIGEPLHARPLAGDISMGALLTQLFATTRRFQMPTQPHLLLLQKTMLVVEGVARQLDPHLNIWEAAQEPIQNWLKANSGPRAMLAAAQESEWDWLLQNWPQILHKMQTQLQAWLDDPQATSPPPGTSMPPPAPAPPPAAPPQGAPNMPPFPPPKRGRDMAARWIGLLALMLALSVWWLDELWGWWQ